MSINYHNPSPKYTIDLGNNERFQIAIVREVSDSCRPFANQIAAILINDLRSKADTSPIRAYIMDKLQTCAYQDSAFFNYINIPLLYVSQKAASVDQKQQAAMANEIAKRMKVGFFGYFWVIHGREPVLPASHLPIMEQMYQDYLNHIELIGMTNALSTSEDWFEVTDPKITDWFPNYSQWHPKAFNPRTHKRVLLRNANGDYKEEFKEVEYNQHAIITSNLSAEYNKARLEIAQEKGIDETQVRLDDARERVIVRTPTPDSKDYDDIYEHNEVEFGLSLDDLMWYNLVIRNKTRNEIFFKRTTERTKMPDVILSTCYRASPALGETNKHKLLQDLLCKANGWIELRNALTLQATPETRNFRFRINCYLTKEVNLALKGCAGVMDMYIDDFYEDLPDLVEELKTNYPRKVYEAFLDSFNPVGFINQFSTEMQDKFQEIVGKILVPYEDMEDVEQTFSCIGTKATVISLDEYSFEMEFLLRKGEVKQVTEWVSSRLYKLLGKTLATNRDSYEHYLLTGDGKTYRVLPSKIEPNVINLVAID